MKNVPDRSAPGAFATTRWTLVLRSRGGSTEARLALAELCEAYWAPVYGFLVRGGWKDDDARELTQEFFARVLAGSGLAGANPARGRFRSFLLGAVKHFLADRQDRTGAAKRGAGWEAISWDGQGEIGEVAGLVPPPSDAGFDRAWAVNLVNRALDVLGREYDTTERRDAYAILKPWLLGEPVGTSQSAMAAGLGWTENALRVAIHRLRRRFRDLVRAEIRQTVVEEAEVGEEMRYLLEVLTHASREGD